ncbi:hypothetical protein [Rubricoccus marinus]|uniref:hypothetical protein n=1 Tax=Rubricoccus marinus TaxID=716817 RepID=UPI0015C6352D|nr:hypothetical protein [Rubricoccus marinus]
MSKTTFVILTTLAFAVATLAIGIRGIENWEPYELSFYYVALAWAAHDVYRRRVQITAS